MNSRHEHPSIHRDDHGHLTPAERDVRQFLVDTGYSVKEIAAQRGTSPDTVRSQVERIYKKLGVHSRPELIVKCRIPMPRLEFDDTSFP